VAHRRVAVADVERAAANPYALGHAVARREHQVVAAEVEARDRRGKEWQVLAVTRGRRRQPLDERRRDPTALDGRRHAAGNVQQREEIGRREELGEDLETALAAPHAGEPVVDQGDAHAAAHPGNYKRAAPSDDVMAPCTARAVRSHEKSGARARPRAPSVLASASSVITRTSASAR